MSSDHREFPTVGPELAYAEHGAVGDAAVLRALPGSEKGPTETAGPSAEVKPEEQR